MYESFYGFTEKPFNTTPDSKFFYPSTKHTEALNSLIYAINERRGFVVVTGEIGAGKTTVCRTMLNKLSATTKVAIITNTHLTCKELIQLILEEFEIEHTAGSKQKLLSQLNSYLIKQLSLDINVVLIIDEAQNLSPKVLEEVRMLSNLETEKEKLIQIILIGQPQLRAKLENIRLEQFKQRVALYYHINGLNRNETQEYIDHRIKLVNTNGHDIFSSQAIDMIHDYSQGIPRLINLVCDSALLSGYIYETKKITDNIIQEVIKERQFTSPDPDRDTHDAILNTHDENRDTHNERNTQYAIRNTTNCCPDCKYYNSCETKWLRGANGQEQLCCEKCNSYSNCIKSVEKVKLN